MKKSRRDVEVFSLSFLDVICCGFGAIILLLVLVKIGEPRALEAAQAERIGLVAKLQEELYEIRGETNVLNRKLVTKREQVSEERVKVARLRGDLSKIQGQFAASAQLSQVSDIVEGRLLAAQQQLSEEQKRLRGKRSRPRPKDAPIGGIPVDSEYIIFIIDTSGSMKRFAWPLVMKKLEETLSIYPKVKGIQVMNDMGQYLFKSYSGKWIPDTRGRRKVILDRLRGWAPFSNSSPVEGITRAIRTYASRDHKVSLYIFGDEFTGNSIDAVVETVDRINRKDADGHRLVRIHAIGFPTVFSNAGFSQTTGIRFATLMRILTRKNGGAFVGLSRAR